MKKVFIDGASGTTGLEIRARLAGHAEVQILEIPDELRKDVKAKKKILAEADLVILCLPDAAALETVKLAEGMDVKILDASTAHRVADHWVYGMPELTSGQRELIQKAQYVSNPGCYPTGFLLAMRPLVDAGLLDFSHPFIVNAVSGYSGGGKQMIEAYEQNPPARDELSYRPYALGKEHKHLAEMQAYAKLERPPQFQPAVINMYRGMLVQIPLFDDFCCAVEDLAKQVHEIWSKAFAEEPFVNVLPVQAPEDLNAGFLEASACNETNRVDLMVFGNTQQAQLVARLDNLGKGASGACVQNMNLMLGFEEGLGLR